ncbi:hypothetical protein [Actinacidiphila glaucinigra]|uniref:hypothetical protein n=1 Tax=Actinacidiphila glaucinigra TaxID=235986 RepID=UPI003D8F89B1
MALTLAPAGGRIQSGKTNQIFMIGAVVFSAVRSTAQTITRVTESSANAIQWDTIELDALGAWNASQPTRWTAPFAGWFTFAGATAFNAPASGSGVSPGVQRDALWFANGGNFIGARSRTFAASGGVPAAGGLALTIEARTRPKLLAAGDYVELVAVHDASASLATATGTLAPYMAVTYSGPA